MAANDQSRCDRSRKKCLTIEQKKIKVKQKAK